MRYVFILTAVFFFSVPAFSQDEAPNYSEMTLEQLQSVGRKSLSKKAKKLHKKALKAAQKAEKKRLRAEAKRLKREEKARRKHNKEANRQIKLVSEVYEKTRILQDDFEAFVEIVSPRYPRQFAWLLSRDPVDFQFRAFFYPHNGELQLRLVSSREITVNELTSENVGSVRGGPERFVTRNNYWHHYRRATLRGGIELNVEPLARYLDECSSFSCEFREDVGITVSFDDIIPALERQEFFQIKIWGAQGESYLISLSPGLIIGYFRKLQDTGAMNEDMIDVVNRAEVALHSRLR